MKSIKKILTAVLSCMLIVCTIGFVGCTKSNATIENFNDITITVGYGSNCSLAQYLTAVDSNGKAYKGELAVTDIDGNEVEVSFNSFPVNLQTDYTATVSVMLEDGTVKTRTLTIKVADMSLPKISIGKLGTGVVGEEYTLPEIATSKAYGQEEIVATVNVYYIDKISMDEQTLVDNKFTPEKPGNYKLVVNAVDSLGNKNVDSESFYVRSKMSGEMLEDFADSLSAENARSNTNSAVWFNSVTKGDETRNGVVKLEAVNVNTAENQTKGNENYFYVKFNRAFETLKTIGDDFDYISVKLYVETEQVFEDNQIRLWSWSKRTSPIEVNKWQEVRINKELIERVNGSDSYWSNDYFTKGHTENYQNEIEYFWGVCAEDGINTTSMFQIKGLTNPLSVYIDEISVARIGVEEYQAPYGNELFKLPVATLYGVDGKPITNSTPDTTEIKFKVGNEPAKDVEVDENGKFTTQEGEYNVKYNLTVGQNTYVKEITIMVQRKPMAENMLEDFDSVLSLKNLWNANSNVDAYKNDPNIVAQYKWYETFGDKNGVVSVNGYGNDMRIKFNRTAEELKALGLDENDTITITYLWTSTKYSAVITTVFGVNLGANAIDKWHTKEISIADIISKNTDLDTFFTQAGSDGKGVQITGNIGKATTLYVAEISFNKN